MSAPEFGALRERFDIIGFDPRGVGASTPVVCPRPLHDPRVTTFPRTPVEFARLASFNHASGEACRRATGALIDHVSTADVVRDVEAIRRALGAQRISWLGLSYGTLIGSRYAERHPDRVRAMVLDGAVDHAVPARRAALDEARATEDAFRRFARWCASASECALHGTDVPTLFDALMASAERDGVPATSLGRNTTAEELTSGSYTLLYRRAAWPLLAQALARASGSDGAADASALVAGAMFQDPTYPAYRTIGCHDFAPGPTSPRDMVRQAANLREAAPHMWRYSEFWDWTSGCLGWPVRPGNPPSPLRVTGAAPILVVGTRHDPATPYAWARSLSGRIEGSGLLTVDGDGHTGILHSSCARSHFTEYLVSGRLPAEGAVCADVEGERDHD
ncbi:alpha/beta hydrolase [Streptomyces sp. NPDC001698]|uniref:alpha/beta hydrolase n=1 Tax=Streptomyces sp. NPDC001698 TaxID=3364601 RepID=UPI0036C78478